jgi:dUTP pyrophosphatase|tara:strand:+ start:564 stop:1007 length:444 start_codon:yes stop_codon:yes gene_type:complete
MILFHKTRDVKSPERSGKNAGYDFFIPNDWHKLWTIQPGESVNIPSGIKVSLPNNTCFIAFNKSGIAAKYSLQVGASVVDENYAGEIHLNLINVGDQDVQLKAGQKILQFVLFNQDYHELREIKSEAPWDLKRYEERGDKGFGSTGE